MKKTYENVKNKEL